MTDQPTKTKADRRVSATGKAKRMRLDDSLDVKDRQSLKIKELSDALLAAGFSSLDEQANALGLSRSTTWHILKAKHKNYGLTGALVNRILQRPGLHRRIRAKLIEYVQEKAAGSYGHNMTQLRRFKNHLSVRVETIGVQHTMLTPSKADRNRPDTGRSRTDRANDLET